MMKTIIALTAATLIATAANAGDVKLEARFADPVSGRTNTTEYKVEYNNSYQFLDYGVELTTKQAENQGSVGSTVSAKVGTTVQAPLGFTVKPRVELGHAMRKHGNFEFWGAEVTLGRQVYGPVSANVGYRHRQVFNHANFNEERLSGGLELAIDAKNAVGANYYRTRGTSDSDAVGVFYKISF